MPNDNDQRLSRDCKRSTTMRAQCDTCGTVPAASADDDTVRQSSAALRSPVRCPPSFRPCGWTSGRRRAPAHR